MSHAYKPLEQKNEIISSDEESQDDESHLRLREPVSILPKSNVFWMLLHVLLTLCLLIGLRVQNYSTTQPICPKLLPLELRKTIHHQLLNIS